MPTSQRSSAAEPSNEFTEDSPPPSSPWRASGGLGDEVTSGIPFSSATGKFQRTSVWFSHGVSEGLNELFANELRQGPCPKDVSPDVWEAQQRLKTSALALTFSYCARLLEKDPERLESIGSSKAFRDTISAMCRDFGCAETTDEVIGRMQSEAACLEKVFGSSRENRRMAQRTFDSLAEACLRTLKKGNEADRKTLEALKTHLRDQQRLFDGTKNEPDSPYQETHNPPCYYVPVTDAQGRLQLDDNGLARFRVEPVPTFLSMVPSAFQNAQMYAGNPVAYGFALAGELLDKWADRLGTLPQDGKLTASEMARMQAAALCQSKAKALAAAQSFAAEDNLGPVPVLERPDPARRSLPPPSPPSLLQR